MVDVVDIICLKVGLPMSEITYDDIKRMFSEADLHKYNELCKGFVNLTKGKNNIELWRLVQHPSELRVILDEIHDLRSKYAFLENVLFFNVWRFNPRGNGYEEIRW